MHPIFILQPTKKDPTQQGFTLVEMSVVLIIIGLLLVFALPTSSGLMDARKRELTGKKLKNIEVTLANFVLINKRLPCPADATSTAGTELRGASPGDCSTNQLDGVVPWITLGLSENDIIDGWNNQITYRVAYGLTRDGAAGSSPSMDMSACDSVGTANTAPSAVAVPPAGTVINTNSCDTTVSCAGVGTTCTDPKMFLANKGFTVFDGAGVRIMDPSNYTGAAYVLISHGGNGVGAYTNARVYISTPIKGVDGTLELLNHNNGLVVSVASTIVSPAFRDAAISEGAAATYFDDILVHPSVLTVIQQAQLGPRSH